MLVTPENLDIAKYWQKWWKVAVSALTPTAIAALTYFISNALNERRSYLRRGEQILSEKQKNYGMIGEKLNVIYVYAADAGDFRNYTPDRIIENKQGSDRIFCIYRSYWSNKMRNNYQRFMDSAFMTYTAVGTNAQINASILERQAAFAADNRSWDPAWEKLFTGRRHPMLEQNYYALVTSFLEDIATFTLNGSSSATP